MHKIISAFTGTESCANTFKHEFYLKDKKLHENILLLLAVDLIALRCYALCLMDLSFFGYSHMLVENNSGIVSSVLISPKLKAHKLSLLDGTQAGVHLSVSLCVSIFKYFPLLNCLANQSQIVYEALIVLRHGNQCVYEYLVHMTKMAIVT